MTTSVRSSMFIVFQTTMLQSIERYMKQAIVDKCYAVSSAALASSLVSYYAPNSLFAYPTDIVLVVQQLNYYISINHNRS